MSEPEQPSPEPNEQEKLEAGLKNGMKGISECDRFLLFTFKPGEKGFSWYQYGLVTWEINGILTSQMNDNLSRHTKFYIDKEKVSP